MSDLKSSATCVQNEAPENVRRVGFSRLPSALLRKTLCLACCLVLALQASAFAGDTERRISSSLASTPRDGSGEGGGGGAAHSRQGPHHEHAEAQRHSAAAAAYEGAEAASARQEGEERGDQLACLLEQAGRLCDYPALLLAWDQAKAFPGEPPLPLSRTTCERLMHALNQQERYDEALQVGDLLGEMRASDGLRLSSDTLVQMMFAHLMKGAPEEVLRDFATWEQQTAEGDAGGRSGLELGVLSTLALVYANLGRRGDVLALWEKMQQADLLPGSQDFCRVIMEAITEEAQVRADATAATGALSSAGGLSEAEHSPLVVAAASQALRVWIQAARKYSLEVDAGMVESVLQHLAKLGVKPQKMQWVKERLERSLLGEDRFDLTEDLLKRLSGETDWSHWASVYQCVADDQRSAEFPAVVYASRWHEKARRHGELSRELPRELPQEPENQAQAAEAARKINRAGALWSLKNQLEAQGRELPEALFPDLMRLLIAHHRPQGAFDLIAERQRAGFATSQEVYDLEILMLNHLGQQAAIRELWQRKKQGHRFPKDPIAVAIAMEAFLDNRKEYDQSGGQAASQVWLRSQAVHGVTHSELTLRMLLATYLTLGKNSEALKIWQAEKEKGLVRFTSDIFAVLLIIASNDKNHRAVREFFTQQEQLFQEQRIDEGSDHYALYGGEKFDDSTCFHPFLLTLICSARALGDQEFLRKILPYFTYEQSETVKTLFSELAATGRVAVLDFVSFLKTHPGKVVDVTLWGDIMAFFLGASGDSAEEALNVYRVMTSQGLKPNARMSAMGHTALLRRARARQRGAGA